jgi:hypothetical protein
MAKVDVEAVVVAWLNSVLGSGWTAYGDKPATPPEQYVLVDRTGGPRESMVLDKAEILIEVYHKTSRSTAKNKANDLADRIIELESYNENITHAAVNSVVNLDDLLGQYHRYQVYVDVWGARNT